MKRVLLIFTAFLFCLPAFSNDEVKLEVDSVYVKKTRIINDYTMIGVQYGVALSTPVFNPNRDHDMVLVPYNVGIMFTKHCKMFGYMPYFGIQAGCFFSEDAYRFAENENGYTDNILSAYQANIKTIEIPVQAHFHVDFWKMKLLANLGVYGGYRLGIKRTYKDNVPEDKRTYANSFHPNERRFDYGIRGGAGLAIVLDPIEIHITGTYKFSWSELHKPAVNARSMEEDDNSRYYYRWAYPTNIIIAVGVHYQLSCRTGTPRSILRKEAREEAKAMLEELRQKEEAEAAVIKQ